MPSAQAAGGSGDDTIVGTGGVDVLRGGAGNDHITGGPGGDLIRGGSGFDVCIVDRYDDARGCEVMLGAALVIHLTPTPEEIGDVVAPHELPCLYEGTCLVTGDEWGETYCVVRCTEGPPPASLLHSVG